MKKNITIIFLLLFFSLNSQTFEKPFFQSKSNDCDNLYIERIVCDKTSMKVDFAKKMSYKYTEGYYVCADKAFHIRTKNKDLIAKYFINIPNCPEKYFFKDHNEVLKFSIVFPPLDDYNQQFDILETKNSGFRFYGVDLSRTDVFKNKFEEKSLNELRTEGDIKNYIIQNIYNYKYIEGIYYKYIRLSKYMHGKLIDTENANKYEKVAIVKNKKNCYSEIEMDNISAEKECNFGLTSKDYEYINLLNGSIWKYNKNNNLYLNYEIPRETVAKIMHWSERDVFLNEAVLVTEFEYVKVFPTKEDFDVAIESIKQKKIEEKKEKEKINSMSTGTGFAITNNGYIVTNYHVIENGTSISIKGINGDFTKSYKADVVQKDIVNDLAILKITSPFYSLQSKIPYLLTTSTKDVGEPINVLGFPLTATMGEEIKFTNGTISAKSGFQGDITTYQISAPIQPGNSGGPMFDSNGNIVGVINAKHTGAENVSYAIKSSYITNLIELIDPTPKLNLINTISKLPLPAKIKQIKQFVYIIEVKYN
jgi:hypothetical protein